MHKTLIEWQAVVHKSKKNSSDWYWSIGIIITTIAVISILLNSVIFGIFIMISGITLILLSRANTRISNFSITDGGVVIDETLYPFTDLDSFWVSNDRGESKLLIQSRKFFVPLIIMPIDQVSPSEVKEIMQIYITEKEITEPYGHRILDSLGF